MDKSFKEKINANRNKNFGFEKEGRGERKYSPKTNKPRPITYERTFEGEFSYNEALTTVANEINELNEFIGSIYFNEESYENNWFDESIYAVAKYMAEYAPALHSKQFIHTKYAISVNGFSVRLENNITLDVHCKYQINDGAATILSTTVALTTHGKVSKESYVNLTGEESRWKKKEYNKRSNFTGNRKPKEEEKEVSEF